MVRIVPLCGWHNMWTFHLRPCGRGLAQPHLPTHFVQFLSPGSVLDQPAVQVGSKLIPANLTVQDFFSGKIFVKTTVKVGGSVHHPKLFDPTNWQCFQPWDEPLRLFFPGKPPVINWALALRPNRLAGDQGLWKGCKWGQTVYKVILISGRCQKAWEGVHISDSVLIASRMGSEGLHR